MKEDTENPCQNELEEFRLATIEWSRASERTKRYVVLTEISAETDLVPRSQEEFNQMRADYQREDEARKKYFEAAQAYLDCQKKHRK